MKNIHIILTTLLGVMIALASCHREEVPHIEAIEEIGAPISFSTIQASFDTKGVDGENNEDEGTESTTPKITFFHVWASRNMTNNDIFGAGGTTVAFGNNNTWIYTPVRYWLTGTYNFAAVSPLSISDNISLSGSIDNGKLELTFGTSDSKWNVVSNPTDLLIAEAASVTGRVNSTSPQSVRFTFNHLLSQIYFEAKNADSSASPIEVTKVEISGNNKVASELKYDMLATGSKLSWTCIDDGTASQDISLNAATELSGSYVRVTPNIMVLSKDCDLLVKVTIKDKNNSSSEVVKSATIKNTGWLPGNRYKYNISVSPDKIIFDQITVLEWDTGVVADDPIIM